MTDEYVKNMATTIYLWAWPMVNIQTRVETFRPLPSPMYLGGYLPVAPPNELCMLMDYVKPQERAVACPNQDVVYGLSLLDLRKEPVVVQVPDFGDRFWVYQVCDQRTDGFASLGKMYGTKPGFYLLAGPDWNGSVPAGIDSVFRSTTAFGVVIPRVFQSDDPEDKKAVQPLIGQIGLYSLSKFDGKVKVTEWSKTPSPPAADQGSAETKWVDPKTFFDVLPSILQQVPPMPGEEVLYGQMNAFMAALQKSPALKAIAIKAAAEAEQKLIEPLFQFVNVGYPLPYRWTTQRNGAQFGTDYLTRTACAKANIFVNKPNETRYFYQDLDSAGKRLNATGASYTVTFAKGQLPLVKGFWSLTLYNQQHFFEPNHINRYSLGTKNRNLRYNPDGSLTIYIQNAPPENSKTNNWLPAPKASFSLYVRCYWPEVAVLTDTWTPPPVIHEK
jgi:hypothetical protein